MYALISLALSALKYPSFVSHAPLASMVQERCGASANNAARYQWSIPTKSQETVLNRLSPPLFLSFFILLIVSLMFSSWTFCTPKIRKRSSMQLPASPHTISRPDVYLRLPSAFRHFDSTRHLVFANSNSASACYILLLRWYTRSPASDNAVLYIVALM